MVSTESPTQKAPSGLSFTVRQRLWPEVGHTATIVLEVLWDHASADGVVEMTHADLAAGACASERTVRRAVDRLAETRWLAREYQHRDDHQAPNRYQINIFDDGGHFDQEGGGHFGHQVPPAEMPSSGSEPGGHFDQAPGGQNGHHSYGYEKREEGEGDLVVDEVDREVEEVLDRDCSSERDTSSLLIDDSSERGFASRVEEGAKLEEASRPGGQSRNRVEVSPKTEAHRKHILDPERLAQHFRTLMLEESSRAISELRWDRWMRSAEIMIFNDGRLLREAMDVISWTFETRGGLITRLRQVRDDYDALLAEMLENKVQKASERPLPLVKPLVPRKRENVPQKPAGAWESTVDGTWWTERPTTKAAPDLWTTEPWEFRRKRLLAERQAAV